jgi:hypothetical protein
MQLKREELLKRLARAKSLMREKEKEMCEKVEAYLLREEAEEFIDTMSKSNISIDWLISGNGNIKISFLIKELVNEFHSIPNYNAEVILKTMIDFARKLKKGAES